MWLSRTLWIRNATLLSLLVAFPIYFVYNQRPWDFAGHAILSVEDTGCSEVVHMNHTLSFSQHLSQFPWEDFFTSDEEDKRRSVVSRFISYLVPFLVMEPTVPVNTSCLPLPLSSFQCPKGTKRYNMSRKVGVLLQFGFDVDTLEIHLHELYDVVDKFFILESTRAHYLGAEKPLLWEIIKDQPRFQAVKDKVIHLILDDADSAQSFMKSGVKFSMEEKQEEMRWLKFLEWNNATKFFKDRDFLGFGDVDEIPSRSTIHGLKSCQGLQQGDPVDIGIWFPYGLISQTFISDFPVKASPFTLGDPTYWTFQRAKEYYNTTGKCPSRMRGTSSSSLLGGMHMSNYAYLPHQLAKCVTSSEVNWNLLEITVKDIQTLIENNPANMTAIIQSNLSKPDDRIRYRIENLEKLKKSAPFMKLDEIAVLPWYYDCNRDRYPTWEGRDDPRVS